MYWAAVVLQEPFLLSMNVPVVLSPLSCLFAVFGVDPDLIREGGTIPIARTFQDVTGKSIIMMPIGGFDDGMHSQNEKISRFESSRVNQLIIHTSLFSHCVTS